MFSVTARNSLLNKLASKGAEVWAFDIPDEAVKKAKAIVKSLILQTEFT